MWYFPRLSLPCVGMLIFFLWTQVPQLRSTEPRAATMQVWGVCLFFSLFFVFRTIAAEPVLLFYNCLFVIFERCRPLPPPPFFGRVVFDVNRSGATVCAPSPSQATLNRTEPNRTNLKYVTSRCSLFFFFSICNKTQTLLYFLFCFLLCFTCPDLKRRPTRRTCLTIATASLTRPYAWRFAPWSEIRGEDDDGGMRTGE